MVGGMSIVMAALSLSGCEPAVGVSDPPIVWQASLAVGRTNHGKLAHGVR